MRILIVGARSKTVEALLRLLRREQCSWEIVLISHRDGEPMDVHGYPVYVLPGYARQPLKNVCLGWEPDVILNAAALTDVDLCEQNRYLAWQVNVGLVETLVAACRVLGTHLVHLSSDYVFDGDSGPYPEQARPRPINYYGKTKLAAENLCQAAAASVTILRVTQIYGTPAPWATDILKWALDKARRGEMVQVAKDLFTNPVFVDDLAWALLSALRRRDEGIVHIGGVEWVSRHEFLSQAFRIAGFPEERLIPLPAEELYRGRALRPRRAGLVITRAKELWTFSPHSLEEALLLALCRNHRGGKVSGETIE